MFMLVSGYALRANPTYLLALPLPFDKRYLLAGLLLADQPEPRRQ